MSTHTLDSFRAIADAPAAFDALSEEERAALGALLRDRFFELSMAGGRDPMFDEIVAAIDPEPRWRLQGLSLSYHPTARFKALRFVEAEKLESEGRDLFARPCAEAPELAAVFVDPEEYSFRTFENIVSLDRLFAVAPLEVELKDRKKLGPKGKHCFTFSAHVGAAARAALEKLDGLGLYVAPLNAVSRGGQRFIFHAAPLADALTAALKSAMPKSLLGGFQHVNPVFRCNRFEPKDGKFQRHHDTPYYDAARGQASRYTLILYLTGGRGEPALRVGDDVAIEGVEAMTCVVFDQAYEHEGRPYVDGRKVFLRTELVFELGAVAHEPAIGELFAKATYFTGESVFAPELAKWTDACYERAAAAHFHGAGALEAKDGAPEPYLHKEFRGVHYVANGYDFWFAKGACSIEDCAAIALLDTVNATIGDKAFRKLCRSAVVRGDGEPSSWIPHLLASQPANEGERVFGALDKEALFPESESTNVCCPFHAMGNPVWDASRCEDIVELYDRAQTFARARVEPAPILMLGEEVFLDRSRFVVRDGAVHILSDRKLEPVNFAACWNFGGNPENYIDVAAELTVLQPIVPPILFRETRGCYHLSFDFFRNTWMVDPRAYRVPIPFISDVDPGDAEEEGATPWTDAIDKKSFQPKKTRGKGAIRWWADDSPKIRELYERTDDDDDDDDE